MSHTSVILETEFYKERKLNKETANSKQNFKSNIFVEMDLTPESVSSLMMDRKFVTIVSSCSRSFKIYLLRAKINKREQIDKKRLMSTHRNLKIICPNINETIQNFHRDQYSIFNKRADNIDSSR